ncbi:MAG: bifunctional DNA-formamidopyrimidine glycosylase/DNA-(apurinic or apyrimidinic site) lyase [Pseudomonadota bacterium]
MPELPEVETVKNTIWKVLNHNKIERLELQRQDLRFPLPADLTEKLTGQRFIDAKRHGKYILLFMTSENVLIVHLGMTGRFLIEHENFDEHIFYHKNNIKPEHEHVIFHMSDGLRVSYYDPRRFGYMDVASQNMLYKNRFLVKLGPDALNISDHIDNFADHLKRIKTPIKNALLNQDILAGVGNIYASEALWRAKINPVRPACHLSHDEIIALSGHIQDILKEAIQAGGSTLKDYRTSNDEKGYFQNNFDVYDRQDRLCSRDDGGIIQKSVMSGRATYFCPVCQAS